MLTHILRLRARDLITAVTMLLLSSPARAVIPGNEDPSQGGDDNNILKVVFNFAYDIVLYGGPMLLVAGTTYFLIHMWGLMKEVRAEKKTKNDFIADGVIGASLVLLSIWGLNFSLGLLESI
ncbi:MAG: DUF2976 domain-containing protein [Alphaproteobacteria bacterium]|nr:DUF2976 domain-containing protein [Alphaproteobacteria bacterium]